MVNKLQSIVAHHSFQSNDFRSFCWIWGRVDFLLQKEPEIVSFMFTPISWWCRHSQDRPSMFQVHPLFYARLAGSSSHCMAGGVDAWWTRSLASWWHVPCWILDEVKVNKLKLMLIEKNERELGKVRNNGIMLVILKGGEMLDSGLDASWVINNLQMRTLGVAIW